MLYENNFLENPFREYIFDKYQQVLYENAGIFSFILCKIPDKYQQVLYENLGVHASNPMHQLININRCCTNTLYNHNLHWHIPMININRYCIKKIEYVLFGVWRLLIKIPPYFDI